MNARGLKSTPGLILSYARPIEIAMGSEIENVFVGNLDWGTEDADLRKLFEPFGIVISARVICDRDTGHSKGFGFIEMASTVDAAKAIAELDGTVLMGRRLRIGKANRSAHRPQDRA